MISHSFGASVAGLNDVDGDAWGDLAVGDPGGQVIGDDRVGRVYVFSGRTRTHLRTLSPPWPTDLFGVGFGSEICWTGDADGDGHGDIAVAAHTDSPPGGPSFAGRVHVFSGASGKLLYSLRPDPDVAYRNFGTDVASVPDIDGDDIDDLIVGSEHEARAYVFSGASGERLRIIHRPVRYFGTIVAGIPDLDGDRRGDVAVVSREDTEPDSEVRGALYIFSGASGELLYRLPAPAFAVIGVPDTTGDGLGDFIVGNDWLNPDHVNDYSGFAQVFSGASGKLVRTILSPRPETSGSFGHSLSSVADHDGDGIPELLVGALWERPDHQPLGAGSAYLLSGANSAMLREVGSLNPQNNGWFGISVAAVPDCNGDGNDELLVGAANEAFDMGNSRGRAYMFLSCPADLNADGLATSEDFFAFLTAFFTDAPRADFNRDGDVNSQDFFDYLAAFFTGC